MRDDDEKVTLQPPLPDWTSELNAEQREAVTWADGPLVVFAGAGSGKTRVITYRILHLIRERSVRPARILGLTFTNKAAGEMRERVKARMPAHERPPLLGTFHAFCARLLRIHGQLIGIPNTFSIYGERDQIAVLRSVIGELNLDAARFNPKAIRGRLDAFKREGAKDVEEEGRARGEEDVFARIHRAYDDRLARQGALDFNDLLLKTVDLLEQEKSLRDGLARRYVHVLVDEFQDTNRVQMRLLELLAPPPDASLCVVGDDDQSIYRWRGANVRNILDFTRLYPAAHTVKLERNYRSVANVLEAAHAVIEKNPTRAPKKLWTDRGAGDPISVYVASSEADEGRYVARRAGRLRDRGIPLARQAVLYRIHAQSRAIEEALRSAGLPYRIVGGTRFFDRAEIRDLVAYLRLARNPSDDVAFQRVMNTPPRGLGARALEAISEEAGRGSSSLFEAARRLAARSETPRRRASALEALTASIRAWHAASTHEPPSGILTDIIEKTSFRDHLEKTHGREAEPRLLNVQELEASIREFETEQTDASMEAFLERIALHSDVDEHDGQEDAIVLMTVHSAKGLEFDSVTVTGLEEDLFPYQSRAMRETLAPREQDEELYEERRLFYVAVTRARTHLALTSSRKRRLFGGSARYRAPSIFLDDIPGRLVHEESWIQHRAGTAGEPTGGKAGPPPVDGSPAGTWVKHARFGKGRVLRVEEGVRRKLVIRFEDGRTRKIIEGFVEPA
ncbi:MAG: UvrD-helicase domain-containing protein [Deltaproteobacteria bacterium]|nr:UvrD-helicase domain-containing protein [Deltaproteobacteria bacterium]